MIKKLTIALATLATLATANTNSVQEIKAENERICKIYMKKVVKYKDDIKEFDRNDTYATITLQRYITVMFHSCETAYDLKD